MFQSGASPKAADYEVYSVFDDDLDLFMLAGVARKAEADCIQPSNEDGIKPL